MEEKFITFGVGGCGCTIAHRMAQQSTMQAVCIDTDAISLENKSEECTTLLIGEDRFDGMGTGGDFASARMTANDVKPELKKQLKDCSLAIVVTGIGGGTGSAITPALLETARSMSIPTMVFIVFPFSMEGSDKNKIASIAIKNIIDLSDIYCYYKNEDLCGSILAASNSSLIEAMEESTTHIVSGITMLWRMFTQPGYINLDLATLLSCTKKGRGQFYLSRSIAYGEGRTQNAINELINGNHGIHVHANETSCALVGIFGGLDLRLSEIGDSVKSISIQLSQNIPIKLGTVTDPTNNGSIEIITILFKNWIEQYSDYQAAYTPNIKTYNSPVQTTLSSPSPQTISSFNTPTNSSQISSALYDRFGGTQSYIYNGENLDEPTYLRKRIPIS